MIFVIFFFKVGLFCIISGNLIVCEYFRDIFFYNYLIKFFSFFGVEFFIFIVIIKYCWWFLCFFDIE